jgi:hypothetical protein
LIITIGIIEITIFLGIRAVLFLIIGATHHEEE